MYTLDPVGRLVPTSRHLSLTAAKRYAQLTALKERRAPRAGDRRRSEWRPRLIRLLAAGWTT